MSSRTFPRINNETDLANATRLSKTLIYQLTVWTSKFYRTVEIPKKSGGTRTLRMPNRSLKAVQRWILRNVLELIPVHGSATGFAKGSSTAKNAAVHSESRSVLLMDIRDFFPTITFPRVYGVFRKVGYEPFVCALLAKLCTVDGELPQGAPSSPALSNIICVHLDTRLTRFAESQGLVYSRYADDICISGTGPKNLSRIATSVERIIEDESFEPNKGKTRIMGPKRAPRITGLVINDDRKIRPTKEFRSKVRATVYHLCTAVDPEAKMKCQRQLQGMRAYWVGIESEAAEIIDKWMSSFQAKLLISRA